MVTMPLISWTYTHFPQSVAAVYFWVFCCLSCTLSSSPLLASLWRYLTSVLWQECGIVAVFIPRNWRWWWCCCLPCKQNYCFSFYFSWAKVKRLCAPKRLISLIWFTNLLKSALTRKSSYLIGLAYQHIDKTWLYWILGRTHCETHWSQICSLSGDYAGQELWTGPCNKGLLCIITLQHDWLVDEWHGSGQWGNLSQYLYIHISINKMHPCCQEICLP